VRGHRTPVMETIQNLDSIHMIATEQTNLTDARAAISLEPWLHSPENYLSGGFIREEDSPGNYQLRQSSNQVQCVIFDARGAPSSE
jgi:hypothetical protein